MPGDPRNYKWLEISDFRPGLVSNSSFAYQGAAAVGQPNNGSLPATVPGQAQNVDSCIALPNGGLGPLPSIYQTLTAPPGSGLPIAGASNVVNGLFVTGGINQGGFGQPSCDSIIVGIETLNTGTNMKSFQGWELVYQQGLAGTTATNRWSNIGPSTSGSFVNSFNTMTGAMTGANSTLSTNPPNPTWLLGYWFLAGGSVTAPWPGDPFQVMYPNPAGGTLLPLNMTLNGPGYCFAHQGRAVVMIRPLLPWYGGSTANPTLPAEYFCYTDPPGGTTIGTQNESFVPEDPTGIEAWGSISASELFCVKRTGGAFILQGDLNSPTVTRLPGVTSTYGLVSRSAQSPIGLIYASNGRGLWSWNGGNSSQKLSPQLEDNFFQMSFPFGYGPPWANLAFDGPSVDICSWGDWIVTSNDYVFDTVGGGWWRLPKNALGQRHLFFQVSSDGNYLYGSPMVMTNASTMVDIYNRAQPASFFLWQSHPFRPPDVARDRPLIIRQLIIRAQGVGTVTVTPQEAGGAATVEPVSVAVNSRSYPVDYRADVGGPAGGTAFSVPFISILIGSQATGSNVNGPAPIVYSVSIAYEDQMTTMSGGQV